MTTKPASLGIIHKILIVFVLINIVGDIGNVAFWWASYDSRMSLNPSVIGKAAGVDNALIIASVVLIIVSIIYIAAFYGLLKRKMWAPKLIIAISVVNRALALVLYQISPAFAFWAIWSIILIALSYFDWRKMDMQNPKTQ